MHQNRKSIENKDFEGKTVVVTGGAQNIGLSIATLFLQRGATVVVADIRPSQDTGSGSGLEFIETDVTSEQSVEALMNRVDERYGQLDVLVNNAGICIEVPLQDMTLADFDRTMSINVRGVFLTTKHAFSLMSKTETQAAIVNISSIEGLGANPLHAAYGASKGAVASFTHNTALEYGPFGIRCNAIAPGWINTPFNESLLSQFPDREKVDREIKALHPVGRLGMPNDIAETALWLASPNSAFITGQEIVVDGGRLAKLPLPNL
jgi:meso-butanediol dehydrogenase/(S,S)-butanediol dehydrogenase/diacetyl reductase